MRKLKARYWMLDAGCWIKGVSAAVAIACVALVPRAEGQTAGKKMSYDNFTGLRSRNIFDPERSRDLALASASGARQGQGAAETAAPVVQATKSDYVVLTGIMMTEDQTLAFFAGTQPDFNKVAPVNGVIAGAVIIKITSSSIDVTRNGKVITVAVGLTVPFDDSAPALPPAAAAPAAPDAAAAPAPADPQAVSEGVPLPGNGAAPASPPPPGNVSDAMKRMMERRQKELQ